MERAAGEVSVPIHRIPNVHCRARAAVQGFAAGSEGGEGPAGSLLQPQGVRLSGAKFPAQQPTEICTRNIHPFIANSRRRIADATAGIPETIEKIVVLAARGPEFDPEAQRMPFRKTAAKQHVPGIAGRNGAIAPHRHCRMKARPAEPFGRSFIVNRDNRSKHRIPRTPLRFSDERRKPVLNRYFVVIDKPEPFAARGIEVPIARD